MSATDEGDASRPSPRRNPSGVDAATEVATWDEASGRNWAASGEIYAEIASLQRS